ncbi:MAG: RDD family protein [Phycisphaerales bacterium]
MSAKICEFCHQDCSNKARVKDPSGHYYCKECYPEAQKAAKGGGGRTGSDDSIPLVASAFDEPVIPTAEMVAPKEDPKKPQAAEKVEDAPTKNCPSCGVLIAPKGIVCTNCGFNIQSGKALKTKIEKVKAAPKSAGGGAQGAAAGNYAGLLSRALAAIVDGIIALVIMIGIGFVGFSTVLDPASIDQEKLQAGDVPMEFWLVYLAMLAASWLYFSLMESSAAQATIGRKLMGISLATTDGGMVSFGRSSARYWLKMILYSIPLAGFLILLVNIVMVLVAPRKQTIHDLATGVVICR